MKKSEINETSINKVSQELKDIKERLKAVVKIALGGDDVAAEYFIMNVISRVHTRKNELVLGNLCTNISNIYPLEAKALSELISNISLMTSYIPLTIDSLEEMKLFPKKNYDTNSMEGSLLQMIDNTFVIIDETMLKEGQIK